MFSSTREANFRRSSPLPLGPRAAQAGKAFLRWPTHQWAPGSGGGSARKVLPVLPVLLRLLRGEGLGEGGGCHLVLA
jgi:hypothetical protein